MSTCHYEDLPSKFYIVDGKKKYFCMKDDESEHIKICLPKVILTCYMLDITIDEDMNTNYAFCYSQNMDITSSFEVGKKTHLEI